jgi:sec-independent protein translocase protein TatC
MAAPKPKRPAPAADAEDLQRMPLLAHLEELRKRIVWSVAALAVAFVPSWIYHQEIFGFLERPIKSLRPQERLIFLGITDPFFLYMKVAALAALFLALPVVLYQLWLFVAPGLYRRERFYLGPFLLFGTAFFVAGGAFAYYVAFPFAAEFLLEIGKDFEMQLEVGRYFGLLMTMILGLGLMFELPIVLLVLAAIGVVTPRGLLKYFRHAVVAIFIVAAVITPTPDVVNLCVFALPTIGLYLLGVGAAWLVTRRKPSPS